MWKMETRIFEQGRIDLNVGVSVRSRLQPACSTSPRTAATGNNVRLPDHFEKSSDFGVIKEQKFFSFAF
jgi:hypothetical protein